MQGYIRKHQWMDEMNAGKVKFYLRSAYVTFTDGYAADESGRDYFRPLMAFIFVLSDEWRVPVNKNYVMQC